MSKQSKAEVDLLTSKEIIERTGISRATLNNYIAGGLIARPQVLPPGPEHGAAPRIGFFPDDTIARIQALQRLKREGWSITRIAEHFAATAAAARHFEGPATPAPATFGPAPDSTGAAAAFSEAAPEGVRVDAAPAPGPFAVPPSPADVPTGVPAGVSTRLPANVPSRVPADVSTRVPAGPSLTPADASQPAYLVDDAFAVVWMNASAATSPLSPLPAGGTDANVFRHLLDLDEARGREPLLRFHLEAARSRGLPAGRLFAGLGPAASESMHARYRELPHPGAAPLVSQSLLPGAGPLPARWIHAVHFQQGVLFALREAVDGAVTGPADESRAPAAPRLTPLAVLVAVLQDAPELWVRLSAEEYFQLLNEVGGELDAIFRQHQGRPGRAFGDALACYFLPQSSGGYLWNALAAAHRTRDAMRQVSQRWRVRKGWELELRVNIGIEEGQDWLGSLGLPGQSELRVLGDAADRAAHLSRASRGGAILLTRNLVGKLSREERQQLTYGVPRPEGTHGEGPLLFTFARLADLAGPGPAPPAVADLAVAELLALQAPPSNPSDPGLSG